jgi:hypothetical protein
MPRASFSHSVELTRPPEEVWASLQDAQTWSGIGPVDHVWEPSHADDGTLESFQWSAHVGPSNYKGSAVIAAANAPTHMKLDLDSSELKGSLIADIDDKEETRLAVTLEVTSKGTMGALFFPLISEAIGRGLPAQVEEFAASLNGAGTSDEGQRFRPT